MHFQRPRGVKHWPAAAALLTLLLGTLAAVIAGGEQDRSNVQAQAVALDALAQRVAHDVETRMHRYEYGLRGARGAVAVSDAGRLDRAGFARYSATRDIDSEFPGARGFGVIWRVAPDKEADFVARAREDGWPSFNVRQLSPHDGERYVIQYIEPVARNKEAVGLDIASEEHRREAADSAMRSGQATLTAPITLVQAQGHRAKGFLLMLPIYRAGMPIGTEAQRVEASIGWSYAPIVIDEVLHSLDTEEAHYVLRLRDPDDSPTEFFFNGSGTPTADAVPPAVVDMSLFGRRWQAEIRATPAFVASLHQTTPMHEVLEIFILSVMCAALVAALAGLSQRTRSQRLELARRAAIVAGSDDAIVVQSLAGHITDWNAGAERLFGFSAAEVIGRSATGFLLPTGLESEDEHIRSTVARGEHVKAFETLRRHRDGTLIEVSITASPIHDADGRCAGSAKILRDVREVRAAQRRLEELNASLEDQVRERTRLLEAARRGLQLVLDATPSLIGYWGKDLRNQIANRAYGEWFGIEPAHVPGMHIRDLLGSEYFDGAAARIEAALRGEPQTFEQSQPAPDGSGLRHTLVHYVPDREDGEVRGFYAFVHDVTELTDSRLRLAAAQRDNAALLQTLHQHAIVSVADRSGLIVEVNDAFCAISGYTRDELLGKNHRIVNSGRHETAFWRAMWTEIAQGRSWRGEVCNRAKDGSLYWVDSVVAPFLDAHGRVEKYVSIRTDITDRKSAQLELQRTLTLLRTVLEASSQVSIIAVDADDQVSVFNRGSELLLGYRADEVVGQLRSARFVEGNGTSAPAGFTAWAAESGPGPRECRYLSQDGSEVPVSLAVTTMVDEEGRLAGYLGIAHDISARMAHERSLRDAMEQSRQASLAKSHFLANMSHEIRTPMNAVIGLSYLLERTALDSEQSQMLERLTVASKSLLAIINDVLDLSKIEAGEMALECAPFDLGELVREIASLMSVQAEQKAIGFDVELDALPAVVEGDGMRLRQVLMNLLSNAVKFTEQGRVRLTATGTRTASHLDVRFTVSDTGVGIAFDAQERLFEPFVQADASTTRRFGGTGLGLSIVKQLVSLMGGEIHLSSRLGHGSEFSVDLRFRVSEEAEALALATPQRPAGLSLAHLNILVVDDNSINQDVARRILQAEGAVVVLASHGEEAVERLSRASPEVHLVLMDVQMPVLDGLDATRQIRHQLGLQSLPVIGLTAGVSMSERQQALAAGMNEVVGKPFDPPALVRCVQRHVTSRRPHEDIEAAVPASRPPLSADWPLIEGIDADDAFQRLQGDVRLFRSLMARLLAQTKKLPAQTDDLPAAVALLHDLKGSAGTLGATRLRQLAEAAERACRASDEGGATQALGALNLEAQRLAQAAAWTPVALASERADPIHPDRLNELLGLLGEHDLAAMALFEELSASLRAHLGPQAFEEMGQQMQNLEFVAAARLLESHE